MQSQKMLDEYRRMTPAQRLQLTFELIEQGAPYLNCGTLDQIRRKHQRIREQNDLANRRVLDALAGSRNLIASFSSRTGRLSVSGSSDCVRPQIVGK